MVESGRHVVTGAFGYSGRYIARRLLDRGAEVVALTNASPSRSPFGDRVKSFGLDFDAPDRLVTALRGAQVLYNTYWVRFEHGHFSHDRAVQNTQVLFEAARRAGVPRIVHVSITNPSEDSRLPYFRGKALLERRLRELGIGYATLRPTVLFGKEDILINNIAWLLRKFPLFGVFGDGRYRLQPIFVDDLAKLAVDAGESADSYVLDATVPETFTFRGLVQLIGEAIGRRRPVISIPPRLGLLLGAAVGRLVGDVVITREEVDGLMAELLYTSSPPAGTTRFSDWVAANAGELGRHYASELARRK